MPDDNPFRFRTKTPEEVMEELWKDIREIKTLVVQTNGRVNSLERFRYMVTGALIVLNVLLVPVALAIVISLINQGLLE